MTDAYHGTLTTILVLYLAAELQSLTLISIVEQHAFEFFNFGSMKYRVTSGSKQS